MKLKIVTQTRNVVAGCGSDDDAGHGLCPAAQT